ncbi:NAD(P)H-binding protein [Ornithinimicrobium sp. F0845]|uniref:NAD(P)H-binding protein n=1 Tax=Ornithinimicrobium sp. F0845 TaxID=2926412 RepID=UPI001FF534C1|nr:NAD(P)H-binding protein [Ornithinimicrobium sp. F0845]MCK0113099.1 NAD(P)H-binding protein [Ornithinimicrobium sp. F0845]
MDPRTALVTGATGYVGGLLVPQLLEEEYAVRVLTRSGSLEAPWADRVDVLRGDAAVEDDLRSALRGVDVAYYLIHSMDGGDFVRRDRELAGGFGRAASQEGVTRIVYLSGLHPDDQELSTHLASRVEVGGILLDSGVPTAVLQAATVIGRGSASFEMLRYLTTRLPVMIAPKWLRNRVQPVGIDDVLHWLVAAARLPAEVNRTFDIGGPDVLSYAQMMQVFAEETGQRRRLIVMLPVMTPWLASHWVGLVTPVKAGVARPLVGSLVHEVVCREHDLEELVGSPPGGSTSYREAVRRAMRNVQPDPRHAVGFATAFLGVGLLVVGAWTAARTRSGRAAP